jgi:hypothetical protein
MTLREMAARGIIRFYGSRRRHSQGWGKKKTVDIRAIWNSVNGFVGRVFEPVGFHPKMQVTLVRI